MTWEEDYEPIERDYEVAVAVIALVYDLEPPARLEAVARIIGIAIAKAIEAEIAP